MVSTLSLKEQIVQQLDRLDEAQMRQLLTTAQAFQRPVGEPGKELVRHAREMKFPLEDLEEIQRAIDEDCEIIDYDGW
jgi:hypothetical protein